MNAKVSVIMSVYNTEEEYLREAIDSILSQTYKNLEFIIVDDASDEKTKKVLESYSDSRIVLKTNSVNLGLTYNLNRAIELSSGEYIARMDADDISRSDRFEKIIDYMERHKDVNIIGSYMDCGGIIRTYHRGIPWELRRVCLIFDNIGLGHPSVVFRKSFLDKHNLKYDESIKKSQDYEMWTRCINYTDLEVYPECLLTYRIHDGQISTSLSSEQERFIRIIRTRQLYQFKPYLSDEDIEFFIENDDVCNAKLGRYISISRRIIKANKKLNLYNKNMLKYVLRKKYKTYLNYHYLNIYRLEKYIFWPLNRNVRMYEKYI